MNQIYTTNALRLRRAIMRRVWYAYGLSIIASKAMLQGLLFGASVIGFWKLVSVSSIINNVLQVQVGQLPLYVFNSLLQAHVLALIAFGIIVFTTLSFGLKVTIPRLAWRYNTQSV